jgi:hypothetical protein
MPSPRQLLWVVGAGILGFGSSALFSGLLHWSRTAFVLVHSALVAVFLTAYIRLNRIEPLVQVSRRWIVGTIGGIILGIFLARGVFSQPASARPAGAGLVWALLWFGVVYGTVDALLLNIVPVLSLYGARRPEELRPGRARLYRGAVALAGSLLVTALYHLGFTEYRGESLVQPLVGNAIITTGYLFTGSPLGSLLAHVVMHVAAVLHGMESTSQLPPHY